MSLLKWFKNRLKSKRVEERITKKYVFKTRAMMNLLGIPKDEKYDGFDKIRDKKDNVIGFVVETRKENY